MAKNTPRCPSKANALFAMLRLLAATFRCKARPHSYTKQQEDGTRIYPSPFRCGSGNHDIFAIEQSSRLVNLLLGPECLCCGASMR
ncbi:Kinesin-like protein [Fusarium oxysporum f. sp. albedinis]|nr:Kinesin-like protein [Fusarium oxysporum f. sp. albedinis]